MKCIINSFTGGFFRTLGRIACYMLIGSLIAYLIGFLNISNVQALSALSVPSTQFNQVNNAYFYNCKSADNCGYSHVVGQASLDNWSYWQTEQSDIYTIKDSSGMAMSFDTDTGFINGNYYTVNLLVAAKSIPTTVTSNTKKVGVGYSPMFAYENAGSSSALSTTPVAIYWNSPSGSTLLEGKGAILSYTFKATSDGNYVWVSMTTQESTTGYWSLYGYNVISQGSQAPSAQDIVDSLQGQFNSIITDISNLHLTIDNQFTHVNSAIGALGQDMLDITNNLETNIFNKFEYLEDSLAQGFDNLGNKIEETNNKIDNVNNSINSDDSDTNSSKCGIVCKLKGIWNGIINLPGNIWNFIKGGFDSIIDLFTPPKGDCTPSPNLLDLSNATFEQVFNGTVTNTETGFVLKTNYNNSEAFAKVKIGKVSDFSGQNYLSFNSNNSSHILIAYCYLKSGSVYPTCTNLSTSNSFATNLVPSSRFDDDLYIYFYGSSIANEEVEFSNIMINKGTEALPYSPYGEETCTGGGTIFDWFGNIFSNLWKNITGFFGSDDVDVNQANNFFSTFDDVDHGGISSIVTAPLKLVNKIDETCSSIDIDLLGSVIELPCGDTLFWNKPEVSSFRLEWNLLIGGPIIYLLMIKLFKVIQGLKNPDDDRIEVAKL